LPNNLPGEKISRNEIVAELGRWLIVRIQDQKVRPRTARPLTKRQEFEKTIAAYFQSGSPLKRQLEEIDKLGEQREFAFLAAIAQRALGLLSCASRNGSGEALYHFVPLVTDAAEALSQITKASPKAVRPIASKCIGWPLMRSTQPRVSDSDSILKEIQLGSALPFSLDKYSKWKSDRAAGTAIALYRYLENRRQSGVKWTCANGVLHWKKVPAFNRDSVEDWWHLAKQIFLRSYPNPHLVAELQIINTAKSRNSPGRKKEEILSKIRERFVAIAQLPKLSQLNR
jgi:hypothetical protein